MTLSDEEVLELGERGFFTRRSFLSDADATHALREAHALVESGALLPAGIRRGGNHRLDTDTRGDRICWLDETNAPVLWRAFEMLRDEVNRQAFMGLRRTELQLALYPGGGERYAAHRDAFPGDDNRRLTAIVYLNPAWQSQHGGQLKLHVEPPVVLEPRLNQLVVFLSERIEHEVMPAFAPRLAATAWFSARD